LPATIYSTFVIEEKYGFNKTTLKTWVVDQIKGLALAVVIGLPLLALIIYIFSYAAKADNAWLYVWLFLIVFQIVMMYLSPVLMSLFNKFEELKDDKLKNVIETYAEEHKFALGGIYQMDGSKRSSKANAFFAGFGKFRKIVLFDTLIEKLSHEELLVVLAHEMGHFKCKHITKLMAFGVLSMGGMLYLLQQLINCDPLYGVFSMEPSIYASIIIVSSIILSPLSMMLGLLKNYYSRKFEYEADAFAVKTTGLGEKMVSALKKLSQSNLSNLTPHPIKTFLEYSHPTIVQRIRAIRVLK
jgi:STE24 endopeptidase